jgi:23S rRNA (guanosine2251-2'-O)-methyltransferase
LDDYIFGIRAVMEAIAANRNIDKVLLQKKAESKLHHELFQSLRKNNIHYQFVPAERLDRITRKNHQGVIAFITRISYTSLEEIITRSYENGKDPFILVLDQLSDVRNFGAISRTAECAGLDGIVIPKKGSVSVTADAIKTSAGALLSLPVSRVNSLHEAVSYMKDAGLAVLAATEKAGHSLFETDLRGPLAVILGSEDTGITPALIRLCDDAIRIPVCGEIKSLNVSVAASVIMYEALRQRSLKDT